MYMKTIDVGPPPMRADDVELLLDGTLREVRCAQDRRAVKVIHGRGRPDRPGVLRDIVRNWVYHRRASIRAVIPGFDRTIKTSQLRRHR